MDGRVGRAIKERGRAGGRGGMRGKGGGRLKRGRGEWSIPTSQRNKDM